MSPLLSAAGLFGDDQDQPALERRIDEGVIRIGGPAVVLVGGTRFDALPTRVAGVLEETVSGDR